MSSKAHSLNLFNRTRVVYWVTQLIGWGLFTGLFLFWNYLEDRLTPDGVRVNFVVFVIGILMSHYFRSIILRKGWLEKDLGWVLPRLALWSVILGSSAFLVLGIIHDLSFDFEPLLSGSASDLFGRILNWVVLLFLWSLCYLGYTYFIRHRREEIRNLRLETANHENQLQNLRAQMNPHFMFNALNSIRALVDEDPDQAKLAITQLSAILRNALATVKRKTVPLGEELDIVKAYLGLELIRYEERLRVQWNIEPDLNRIQVPPMLLQTLVENAVRHGVAKYADGGDIHISAQKSVNGIVLSIRNSGHFETPGTQQMNGGSNTTSRVGIGLRNTRRRLEMLYKGEANLKIQNRDGMVVTEVEIPDS
ncbi:MAG: histidine kinase [Flavobacteriales bacterium]|nr:histidine kinase [Flavobacteriales bacterium]MBK6946190.1 histidine kinase [Flavobacteriales bacterium]MBK7238857.1 histidine kinase [Flavobacteriales bacterium]MBK9537018.1 histidine kinase [Flavobacteriales bacterium]MBP9139145.1 histidine kinase [Flavobacteriales bacterium]